MRKFGIILVVFVSVLFLTPSPTLATVGASCCGQYAWGPINVFSPANDGLSCTSSMSPSAIRNILTGAGFCINASTTNAVLLFLCNIPNNIGNLPTSCDGAERCDLSNGACNVPEKVQTTAIQDPVCPKGYRDLVSLVPFIGTSLTLNGWDQTKGRVCCKADFLDQVVSPLKCFIDSQNNIIFGTACADSRSVFQTTGPNVGKCVQVRSFFWSNFWKSEECDGVDGIDTAIGCVPTGSMDKFLEFILRYAFFASGGIILLMVIATGYTLLTSQGNPEKLQAAKENLVALFSGLILIGFSLIILQAIGRDILNLPTFK